MTTTHITILVDRSGSMSSMKEEATNSVREFIAQQKEVEGDCTLLLADFDGMDPFKVYYSCDLHEAKESTYALEPRGATPLYDAIGMGLVEASKFEAEKHYFVIITDGAENASKEYDKDRVNRLIKEHEDRGWEFIFMAAGQEAWSQAYSFTGTQMISSNYAQTSFDNYGSTLRHISTSILADRKGEASSFSVDNS